MPGNLPWDRANAVRIGGVTGAVVGGGIAVLTGWITAWPVIVGAVIGAAIAYWLG